MQRVMALKPEERVMILAPIVRGRKGEFKKEMEKLAQHGFSRARVDGELVSLEDGVQSLQVGAQGTIGPGCDLRERRVALVESIKPPC